MLNRKVSINLYKAQVASDNAKCINKIAYDGYINATYTGKDTYIIRAIETIIHRKNTGFSFYVTDGGITPYLVYFNFQIGITPYQVSFHSYNGDLSKYKSPKKHHCIWDEKSSRDTVDVLYNYVTKGVVL